jgi:hypothetical protein
MTLQTPWGAADYVKPIAPGIEFVGTPSHGGYHLSRENVLAMPAAWRAASFNGQGERGWFEEDCDWCMVALTFPQHFPADALEAARKIFDGWIAKKLG